MRRRDPFITGEYYHIFNRGVEKRNIFKQKRDYERFVRSIIDFNTALPSWKIEDRPRPDEQLVHILAYCLNPNHFHLILKQKQDNGVTTFMKKLCTGYAMYFNKKYDRSGVLFQGRFKAVIIGSNNQLLYVSAYVNCNNQIHGIGEAKNYPWSSFDEYRGKRGAVGCQCESIIGQFSDPSDYEKYALEQALEMRGKKKMKELMLES